MNAITLLTQEHEKVRKQMEYIHGMLQHPEKKKKLFSELCHDIIKHEQMEHEVWYPCFQGERKLDATVSHLLSEEKHAEKFIEKFSKVENDEKWNEMFIKFKKEVEHHANEEETKLFPKVIDMFSTKELDEIGAKMEEFRKNTN